MSDCFFKTTVNCILFYFKLSFYSSVINPLSQLLYLDSCVLCALSCVPFFLVFVRSTAFTLTLTSSQVRSMLLYHADSYQAMFNSISTHVLLAIMTNRGGSACA